jgi:hypothetical protein
LATLAAQRGKERSRPSAVKLARDVVEKKKRAHSSSRPDHLDLRKLQREHRRAMLSL